MARTQVKGGKKDKDDKKDKSPAKNPQPPKAASPVAKQPNSGMQSPLALPNKAATKAVQPKAMPPAPKPKDGGGGKGKGGGKPQTGHGFGSAGYTPGSTRGYGKPGGGGKPGGNNGNSGGGNGGGSGGGGGSGSSGGGNRGGGKQDDKNKNKNKNGANTTTTKAVLTPQQKKLLGLAMPEIKDYANNNIGPGPKTVTPFTAEQTTGQAMALNAAKQQDALAKAGATAQTQLLAGKPAGADNVVKAAPVVGDMANPAPAASNFLTGGAALDPNTNPALMNAITAAIRPISDDLVENQLPAIRGEAVTSGNFGSSRQGIAEGLALSRAQRNMGDVAAGVANEGYKSGLGAMSSAFGDILGAASSAYGTKEGNTSQRYGTEQGARSNVFDTTTGAQTNALGLLPQTQGAQTAGAVTTSGVGEVKQGQAERGLQEDLSRYMFKKYEPFDKASNLLSLMPAIPGGSNVSTGPVPQANPISGALGGASLGATLGSVVPGVGTGIGALGGGVLGALSSLFKRG